MSVLWLISEAALAADPSGFVPYETGLLDRGISLVGIFAFVALAWLISENRKKVAWRTVAWGVGLQLIFGLVILLPVVSGVFYGAVNGGVAKLLSFSDEGTKFVLEPLVPHAIFMKVDKPKNYVEAGTDCDDGDGASHGAGVEVCDGADNDCDGKVDDADDSLVGAIWYPDSDGDGFGSEAGGKVYCTAPAGWVKVSGDCDDTLAKAFPGAEETCADSVDLNCDGSVGDADADADGVKACEDCDDSDPGRRPDAVEVCNQVDDDCDGLVDDEDDSVIGQRTFYLDADGDGKGAESTARKACFHPVTGAGPALAAAASEASTDATDAPETASVPDDAAPSEDATVEDSTEGSDEETAGSESVDSTETAGSESAEPAADESADSAEPSDESPAIAAVAPTEPPSAPAAPSAPAWVDDYVPVDVDGMFPTLFNVGFAVLPTIIFFSALMSLLYHVGIMQPIVRGLAWVMMRTLGTSGAETLSAAGNIFVGQTEAPLLVRPYVNTMTRSELMAVMTGGFATVAGGVLGLYVSYLQNIPNIAGHLVIASIISAPAALAIAKVMIPETQVPETAGQLKFNFERTASNAMEAAANGATEGMKLLLNVAAMLIAIVALVAMLDWFISLAPITYCPDGLGLGYSCSPELPGAPPAEGQPLSLALIMGFVFAPIALLMGVPLQDITAIGTLLGEKIVLTELVAYTSLSGLINGPTPVITERSAIIASYALCGFANFASIGIQIGGIGGIAPKRMGELASLGFRAMIAGAIAACMTGAVAGVFL